MAHVATRPVETKWTAARVMRAIALALEGGLRSSNIMYSTHPANSRPHATLTPARACRSGFSSCGITFAEGTVVLDVQKVLDRSCVRSLDALLGAVHDVSADNVLQVFRRVAPLQCELLEDGEPKRV